MATPNRFAIRSAGNATFYRLDGTKDAIVTLRTLKVSSLETTGETTYARGGDGNVKLVGFSSNREARMNLEDAIFDKEAIAMITGNAMSTGATVVAKNEIITVGATNKASVTKTPTGALTSVYVVNADGTNGQKLTLGTPATESSQYSINAKELTFHSSITQNTKIRVYYNFTTDITASKMRVTSDAFGGTFKIVLDVIVRDEYTKKDFAAQVIVPNGKFEDNFNFNFSADGDPATLTLPIEILKDPLSTNMWEMVIFDEESAS